MNYKDTYLVFSKSELKIGKILDKRISHLCIVSRDKFNWIMLEPTKFKLEWEILPFEHDDDPFVKMWPHSTIVKMNVQSRKTSFLLRPSIMSCVSFAKYYLGIKCWALTPKKLYNYIIKNELGEDYYG